MKNQLSILDFVCGQCWHPLDQHSREAGVGCLHRGGNRRTDCDCMEAGDSEADQ